MAKFEVAYIPVGVPTFHLESAQKEFDSSIQMIKNISEDGVFPKEMLLSIEKLDAYLDTINPDLIILQNITFANAAYASEVLKRFSCPIVLWTLREPVIDGGRLRLNSLTGAYSAANAIKTFRREKFVYVFGSPKEKKVVDSVRQAVAAAKIKKDMRELKLVSIGHTPQGFGFGRALDGEMLKTFGVTLESIEARELIEKAKGFTQEECREYQNEAKNAMVGLEDTKEDNLKDFTRLYKAYKDYVLENHVGAISSRCWPDFFTAFGTPVCAVLAMLNDLGVAASCEADTYGALSMYIGMKLSDSPVFFGDPVSMDEKENTITFWHCGTAACSLAKDETGACVGVHCNRKIGPTMEFGCRPCDEVTVFRIGKKPDGSFRFFLMNGKALDKPKQFFGTSAVVQATGNAENIVKSSVEDGWEPHFVVVYKNVEQELKMLGDMLDIEICEYH